jgi:hypothetical protein
MVASATLRAGASACVSCVLIDDIPNAPLNHRLDQGKYVASDAFQVPAVFDADRASIEQDPGAPRKDRISGIFVQTPGRSQTKNPNSTFANCECPAPMAPDGAPPDPRMHTLWLADKSEDLRPQCSELGWQKLAFVGGLADDPIETLDLICKHSAWAGACDGAPCRVFMASQRAGVSFTGA